MAIIAGTTVNWALSPRVITIPLADTSITVDDLQDTLQDLEDDEAGMVWPHLRNTSGGEDLGGGVTVGLTIELQNAQVSFTPRTLNKSTGTVTSANAAGTILVDSAATFITDGVTPGATIINFTDLSATTLISVDSETQITHYPLADGTGNDWGISDVYKIWNEVQCEITGGNSVAIDGVGASISPIFPTFGTQVIKTSSSSATTSNQTALEHAVFGDEVLLDQANSSGLALTGTEYPAGTSLQPSLNIANATAIAVTRGFQNLKIRDSAMLDGTVSLDNYHISGDNRAATLVTFSAADTDSVSLDNMNFTGSMSGSIHVDKCVISTISGIGGTVDDTIINDTLIDGSITLAAGNTRPVSIINCGSIENNQMTLDVNGSSGNITIQNYTDRLEIINMTTAINLHISSAAGCELTIAASCTAVNLLEIHGNVNIVNNSALVPDDDTTQNLAATSVWTRSLETGLTVEEAIRVILSSAAAKASGLDTLTPVFRDINDTKNRISATTDAFGNRSAVTIDGT